MSRKWLMQGAFVVGLAGIAYYLWSDGYRNVFGYVMLLLCPLMHLFMHQSHKPEESSRTGTTTENTDRPACH